jgi:hypothetical protein
MRCFLGLHKWIEFNQLLKSHSRFPEITITYRIDYKCVRCGKEKGVLQKND